MKLPAQNDPKTTAKHDNIHQQPKKDAGIEIVKTARHVSDETLARSGSKKLLRLRDLFVDG
jgi:hypothetical protein